MQNSKSQRIQYNHNSNVLTETIKFRILQQKIVKAATTSKIPVLNNSKSPVRNSEVFLAKKLITIQYEDKRREEDLNHKLFQTIERKLRKSEIFNKMFDQFMDLYKVHEIKEFNKQIDENSANNHTSYVNLNNRYKLFDNSMQDENIEFYCFQQIVRASKLCISQFINIDKRQVTEFNENIRVSKVDLDPFRDKYFISFGELNTSLELKSLIISRLKAKPVQPKKIQPIIQTNTILKQQSTVRPFLIKVVNSNNKSKIFERDFSRLNTSKSPLAGIVKRINTEIDKKKEFDHLRKYIKGIIKNTVNLKTNGFEVKEMKSQNETTNEKYHRLSFIKRIFKTNIIFYLMLQIDNKQGFIKIADQIDFI